MNANRCLRFEQNMDLLDRYFGLWHWPRSGSGFKPRKACVILCEVKFARQLAIDIKARDAWM